jgi:hypothetical protein
MHRMRKEDEHPNQKRRATETNCIFTGYSGRKTSPLYRSRIVHKVGKELAGNYEPLYGLPVPKGPLISPNMLGAAGGCGGKFTVCGAGASDAWPSK